MAPSMTWMWPEAVPTTTSNAPSPFTSPNVTLCVPGFHGGWGVMVGMVCCHDLEWEGAAHFPVSVQGHRLHAYRITTSSEQHRVVMSTRRYLQVQ